MSSGPGRGAARRTVAGVAQDIVLRTCPGVSAATWRAPAIRTLALIAMFATLAKRPRAPSPGSPPRHFGHAEYADPGLTGVSMPMNVTSGSTHAPYIHIHRHDQLLIS